MTITAEIPIRRRLRIDATRNSPFDLRELWAYRELIGFLIWRDVKVRYKQTAIGVGWAVIQPVTTMVIFTVIFGHLAGIKSGYGVPYPLFAFSGLLPWTYFASSLAQSSASLVGGSSLLSKIYFPRLALPIAAICVPLVDLCLSFIVLVALFAAYGRYPSWRVVTLPLFVALALLVALGAGLWLSALNVRYRDVPYALPFLTQIWLYLTPVVYPVTLVPSHWRWLLALNPMAGVVDGFRWAVLGHGAPHGLVLAVSGGIAVALLLSGIVFFRRAEATFADVI